MHVWKGLTEKPAAENRVRQQLGYWKGKHLLMMNGGRGWRNSRQMDFSHRRNPHPPHHEFAALTYACMAPFQGWADKAIMVRSNAPHSSSVGFCFCPTSCAPIDDLFPCCAHCQITASSWRCRDGKPYLCMNVRNHAHSLKRLLVNLMMWKIMLVERVAQIQRHQFDFRRLREEGKKTFLCFF